MSFPVPPAGLPGLAALLAGDLWDRWVEQQRVFPLARFRAAVRYVRLKAHTSCRLAVLHGDPPQGFLLHLYPDTRRAEEAWAKVATRKLLLHDPRYGAFLDRSHAVVAVPFPNDPELPALRHFHRDYRLKQALLEYLDGDGPPGWRLVKHRTTRRLLAYKPGRRAVYRVDACLERREDGERRLVPVHVRIEPQRAYEATERKLAAIRRAAAASSDLALPGGATRSAARGLTMRDWARGSSLAQLLATARAGEAAERAGRALAVLHGLPLSLGDRAGDPVGDVARQGADLAARLPGEARRIEQVGQRLAALLPALFDGSPAVTVHGDFHPGQVVLGDGPPLVADFDRAGAGHPATDLGSMLAYLAEAGDVGPWGEAFLDGYAKVAPRAATWEQLAVGRATAAFHRLAVPFRRLAPDWPRLVQERLDRIESRLMAVTR